MKKRKATIAEIEALLEGPPCQIQVNPDGSLTTINEEKPLTLSVRSDKLLSALDKGLEKAMKRHRPHFQDYGCRADNPDRFIISKTLYWMYSDMREILNEVKGI